MTNTKHTPGPWNRDRSSGLNCDVRAANNRKVALCFGLSQTARKTKEAMDSYKAECDANANLIAAAPDLLATLQEMLEAGDHILNCDDEIEGMMRFGKAHEQACAAIAKATGEGR